jgi:hypothetical protein
VPQAPQFIGSLVVSTHAVPHILSPCPHVVWQMPFAQASPASHACPQPPQLVGLDERSVHVPLHAVCPAGHVMVGGGAGAQWLLGPHAIPCGQSDCCWQAMITLLLQLAAMKKSAASAQPTTRTCFEERKVPIA